MAGVGALSLALHVSAAYVSYRALALVWTGGVDLASALAAVGALTLAVGYLSHRFGTARLLAGLDAAELPAWRAPELYRRRDRLCARSDVEPPRLLVTRLSAPNAFAFGSGGDDVIVFDRTLLELLDTDELEAILAHELAHLESGDGLIQSIADSAVQTVVVLAAFALLPAVLVATGATRALAWLRGRPPERSNGPVERFRDGVGRLIVLLLVGLTLALRAYSRRREYAADDRAVALTGKPVALARALLKIERSSRPGWGPFAPPNAPEATEHPLARLLSTHPSTDDRIERLRARAEDRRERPGRRISIE